LLKYKNPKNMEKLRESIYFFEAIEPKYELKIECKKHFCEVLILISN
jgi:hypothetical protein